MNQEFATSLFQDYSELNNFMKITAVIYTESSKLTKQNSKLDSKQ